MLKYLAAAALLLLVALPAEAQQRQGCASGFCAISNAPQQEAAADIDQIDADMKRQIAQGAPAQSQAPGGMGMMGMCPCMRMMAMMMRMQGGQGMGMGGMGMGSMGKGGMQDMPGMTMPKPDEKKAPAQ